MNEEERSYKLRLYRLEHGLTQREFAKMAGVCETTIVYIERKGKKNSCKKAGKYLSHGTSRAVVEKIDKIILEKEVVKDDCKTK